MSARENARNLRTRRKRSGVPPIGVDTFRLFGYEVVSFEQRSDVCNVVVRRTVEPLACIYGCTSQHKPKPAGSKIQGFSDSRVLEKPCHVAIDRQRYYCDGCKRYFSAPLPQLHPRRRMTMRLFNRIREMAADYTFAEIAKLFGLDERTIRNVVEDCNVED